MKLTNRELEIMHALWSSALPMTALEILDAIIKDKAPSKKTPSVFLIQNVLRSLLGKNAIEVRDYVRIGKTTARQFSAKISVNDYAEIQIGDFFSGIKKSAAKKLLASLLDTDEYNLETINELEQLIEERKARLLIDKETQ